jgi:hypothetical protein
MTPSMVRAHSTVEFFKEQVETACSRQSVQPGPLTSYYLVSLLADFAKHESGPTQTLTSNEALGVTLMRALQGGGTEQRLGLKHVGDVSLFISGFFSDSLRRSLVDVDYYMSLGGYAYRSLATIDQTLSPVFDELSEKFGTFVDVLAEVSEQTGSHGARDLLRLYERWVRTGSRRDGDRLAERGIAPNLAALPGWRRPQ